MRKAREEKVVETKKTFDQHVQETVSGVSERWDGKRLIAVSIAPLIGAVITDAVQVWCQNNSKK